jgi:hypothetical protein
MLRIYFVHVMCLSLSVATHGHEPSRKENEEEEGVNGTAQPTTSSCLEKPIVSPALCPRQRV